MAVTQRGRLQPNDNESLGADGRLTKSFTYKGKYSDLASDAKSFAPGDKCPADENWIIKTWNLVRCNAGQGLLTYNCTPAETSDSQSTPAVIPLKETWSVHSVRNDVNVLAYCGDSVGANPLRDQIELWLKEADGMLAQSFQYRDPSGTIVDLTEPSKLLAAKMARGVESVMRFYILVTRKRIYTDVPDNCLENLGYIDTPPTPSTSTAGIVKFPANLGTKLSGFQFVKCQDDIDELPDTTWSRTEGWMGIPKTDSPTESPWDSDLYGANRWSMPADTTSTSEDDD